MKSVVARLTVKTVRIVARRARRLKREPMRNECVRENPGGHARLLYVRAGLSKSGARWAEFTGSRNQKTTGENMAKLLTAEETAKRELRWKARTMGTLEVLAALKTAMPEVWARAEVVGCWVWTTFDARPSEQVRAGLLDLGFIWNHTRLAWQHACGQFRHHSKTNPYFNYAVVPARELESKLTV